MWSSSERHWRRLRPYLAVAGWQALLFLLAAVLAPALHGPSAQGTPRAVAAAPAVAPSELDRLRAEAALGDADAAGFLVGQLLDRYERAGDADNLYEAVQWIDRGWDTGRYQQSGLATRVFERHCGDRVLRWHWLCEVGE